VECGDPKPATERSLMLLPCFSRPVFKMLYYNTL